MFTWQDKTGPTYPLHGTIATSAGPVQFEIIRSEIIGHALPAVLLDPVPKGVTGKVQFRRYKSHDAWTVLPMKAGEFEFYRRGRRSTLSGVGAALPSLQERAGKYEIFVHVIGPDGKLVSVTGERPFYARYKANVPRAPLMTHVFVIFLSMAFAIRTVLQAAVGGNFKWLLRGTMITLILGAFFLGPLIQWYAFGVWWAGVPFGHDWTDNKVLIPLAAWAFAVWANRGNRRNVASVYVAGIVTLLVYFIPHSVFGSEFDYRTKTGHGTLG